MPPLFLSLPHDAQAIDAFVYVDSCVVFVMILSFFLKNC